MSMKIVKFTAQNYKKLKAVEITPEGNTVTITGKNGAGKSSVLDAIWAALCGGDAGKKNTKPIRDGEKEAKITLDLGDLLITRTWTADDKTYLTVENKDGATYKGPQGVLDALVGRLTFDPLAFAGLKAKEQVAALLEVVDLDIDPAKLDEERAEIFAQRTDVNREVKRLESVLVDKEEPGEDTPTKEESASDLLKAIGIEREKEGKKCSLSIAISHLKETIKREKDEVQKLQESIDEKIKYGKKIRDEHDKIVVQDIDALEMSITALEGTNCLAREAREYVELSKALEVEKKKATMFTEGIIALDEKKAKAISNANMPVKGLSFDEDGLTYKGVPFAQASSAEQLKVSVAMAMAINPKLRVLRIQDGSLLDSDSMKIIEQMAKTADYQVWIEVVDDSGKVGVYIEDGEVK